MNPLAKLTITRERLYRLVPSIQMNNTFFGFESLSLKFKFQTTPYLVSRTALSNAIFRKSCGDEGGGDADYDDFVFPDGVSHEISGRTWHII